MTRISLIHAVPTNEYRDRGNAVAKMPNTLYLSLTEGEMQLDLLKQRLTLLSQFYPEVKAYKKGVKMLDVALKNGLHRGVNFVGAIDNELQVLANTIARNVNRRRPAAGTLFGRNSEISGIGDIIPIGDRFKACRAAAKTAEEYFSCDTKLQIERIFNDRIEGVGHHVLYKGILENYPNIPSRVFTKLILHNAGISAMSNTAEINSELMSGWVENAIMFKNAASGAGPLSSAKSSFYLSDDPEVALANYYQWTEQRTGSSVHGPAIGSLIATITIIVTIVSAAIKVASELLTAVQKAKFMAMSTAQGFGTDAYRSLQSDWPIDPNNPTTGEEKNKTMLYLAMAGGAYLLLNEK